MNKWQCKMCWALNPDEHLRCGGCGHFYTAGARNEDAHRLMMLEAKILEEILERKATNDHTREDTVCKEADKWRKAIVELESEERKAKDGQGD